MRKAIRTETAFELIKENTKEKRLEIRISSELKERLQRLASNRKQTPSETIRALIIEAIRKEGLA